MIRHWASEMILDPTTQIALRFSMTFSNDSKRALIDSRVGQVASWTATAANAGFSYDMGSIPTVTMNRLVIPAGHTLGTWPLRLFSDDNVNFTSATLLGALTAAAGSGVIDMPFQTPGSERYFAFQIVGSSAEIFTAHEAWLGVYEQLSSTAAIDPSFESGWQSQLVESLYPGGVATLEVAAPRRTFTLNVRNITSASADYTILESLIQNGRARPFWYWPPDDTDAGPYLVKLDADVSKAQEFAAPSVSIRYRYEMRMTEQAI